MGYTQPGGRSSFPLPSSPAAASLDDLITAPGDPDFSLGRAGSQEQMPAASAQARILRNRQQAARVAEMMTSIGVPIPENVTHIAQTGLTEQKKNMFTSALTGFLAPYRTVNFAIQDMLGGREEKTVGLRSPTAKDYWDVFTGKDVEAMLNTGIRAMSGSDALGMMGWEEADQDDTFGKWTRGTATFLYESIIDPTTYLTFGASGLGKKVLATVGDEAATNIVRQAVREGGEDVMHRRFKGVFDDAVVEQQELLAKKYKNQIADLEDAGDFDMLDAFVDQVMQEADDLAYDATLRAARDEILTPLLQRDFGNAAIKEWGELLPNFAKGGTRFALPFLGKKGLTGGFIIPGTQGLGRKLVGDTVRNISARARDRGGAYNKLAGVLESIAENMDMDKILLAAVAKKKITGGQYMAAKDAIANHLTDIRLSEFHSRLQFEKADIFENALKDVPGFKELASSEESLNRAIFGFMNGRGDDIFLGDSLVSRNSDLYKSAERYRTYSREVTDTLWKALDEIAPDLNLGHLKEYMPLGLTGDTYNIVRELAEAGATTNEILAKYMRGETAAGAFYLGKLLGAVSGGGQTEAAIGGTARALTREQGFSPFVVLNDLGLTVMGDPTELATAAVARRLGKAAENMKDQNHHIDIVTLNDLMEPILEELAANTPNFHLGGRTMRLLNEDPFQAISDYAVDLDNALRMRHLVDVLEANGLVLKNQKQVDLQATLADWVTSLTNDPKMIAAVKNADKSLKGKVAGIDDVLAGGKNVEGALNPPSLRNMSETEMATEGAHIRKSLRVYNNSKLTRHVMKPIDDDDVIQRADYMMDVVEGWRANGATEPKTLWYDVKTNSWADDFDELADRRKTEIMNSGLEEEQITDLLDDWGTYEKARLRGHVAEATLSADDTIAFQSRVGLYDGPRGAQEAVAELAYANGFTQVNFNHKDEVWRMLLPRDVYELDDVAALKSVSANWFGQVRNGVAPDPNTLHSELFTRTVRTQRNRMKARSAKPLAEARRFNKKHVGQLVDATPEQLRGVKKGILVKDEDGVWRVQAAFDNSDHGEIYAQRRKTRGKGIGKDETPSEDWYTNNLFDGTGVAWHVDRVHGRTLLRFETMAGVRITDEMRDVSVQVQRLFDSNVDDVAWDFVPNPSLRGRSKQTNTTVRFATRSLVDPDDMDDLSVWIRARDEALEALEGATKRSPATERRMLAEYQRDYGEDFVQSLTQWTSDIMKTEKAATDMWNRLYNMLQNGRVDGDIETALFHVGDTHQFELMVNALKRNAERLGIKADTFDIVYSSAPIRHEGNTFVNPHMFAIGGDALTNSMVEQNMAQWMGQLAQNMASAYTPIGVAQLKASVMGIQRWWKTMTTITRPTFHVRNLLGGAWNNQIIGVGMSDYAKVRNGVMPIRAALKRGKTFEEALGSVKNPETREMFRAAFNEGLLGLSFSSAEFRGLSALDRSTLMKTWGMVNPLDSTNHALARSGALFMESIEDFLRMSAFSAWYDPRSPGSAKVAKEMALAAHFDYKNLTKWETKVKNVIPFFVWQRRNIPLQLQTMMERPGLMTRYAHLLNAFDDNFSDVEQDEYGQSKYMYGEAIGTDIVLNEGTPFWSRLMIDPDIPVKDLYEVMDFDNPIGMFTNGVEYMMESLGPVYQLAQDLIEHQEYGNVNAPAGMKVVLAQLARAGLFDTTLDGDVQVHYLARTVWNMAAPYQSEYADMGLIPQNDPERRLRMGQSQDEGFGERGVAPGSPGELLQRIGLTLAKGVGVKAQTPRDSASQTFEAQAQVREALNKLFKEQPGFKEFYESQR